jgi:hypothetical protein
MAAAIRQCKKQLGRLALKKVAAKSFADGASTRRTGRQIWRRRRSDSKQTRSRWFDGSSPRQTIFD